MRLMVSCSQSLPNLGLLFGDSLSVQGVAACLQGKDFPRKLLGAAASGRWMLPEECDTPGEEEVILGIGEGDLHCFTCFSVILGRCFVFSVYITYWCSWRLNASKCLSGICAAGMKGKCLQGFL